MLRFEKEEMAVATAAVKRAEGDTETSFVAPGRRVRQGSTIFSARHYRCM